MASLLEQAIRYQYPETIPTSVSILPAAWIKYGAELQRLCDEYPQFFGSRKVDLDNIVQLCVCLPGS